MKTEKSRSTLKLSGGYGASPCSVGALTVCTVSYCVSRVQHGYESVQFVAARNHQLCMHETRSLMIGKICYKL